MKSKIESEYFGDFLSKIEIEVLSKFMNSKNMKNKINERILENLAIEFRELSEVGFVTALKKSKYLKLNEELKNCWYGGIDGYISKKPYCNFMILIENNEINSIECVSFDGENIVFEFLQHVDIKSYL